MHDIEYILFHGGFYTDSLELANLPLLLGHTLTSPVQLTAGGGWSIRYVAGASPVWPRYLRKMLHEPLITLWLIMITL